MLRLSPITIYILLAIIVGLFYGNTLRNSFVHDDVWQVEQNPRIRSFGSIGEVFTGCIAQDILGGCEDRGFYWRPTQSFFYLLTYQVSAAPWAFHLANLIFFWVAGVLVYELARLLGVLSAVSLPLLARLAFGGPPVLARSFVDRKIVKSAVVVKKKSSLRTVGNPSTAATPYGQLSVVNWLPLLAAVIFLTHPINSEAVNWVSATPELLLTVFGLATIIFFIKYLKSKKIWHLVTSLILFFIALLTKETAVFLAFVIPVCQLTLADFKFSRKDFSNYLKLFGAFLIPIVIYLTLRTVVLGRVIYKYEGYYSLSLASQILTALALLPRYLVKLVNPLPLSFQEPIEPIRTFSGGVLPGLVVIVMAVGLMVWVYRSRLKLMFFGLFLIFVGILPPLLFVNKLGEFIFSERYLLISTVGFSLIVSQSAALILTKGKSQRQIPSNGTTTLDVAWLGRLTPRIKTNIKIVSAILVFYLVWSWWLVFNRNGDWQDNLASYQAMIRVDPTDKRAHLKLGQIYQTSAETKLAKEEYKKALLLDPNYREAKESLSRVAKSYENKLISFDYPGDWQLFEESVNRIELFDTEKKNKLLVTVENLVFELRASYLEKQKETFGTLENQGPARIPGIEEAYVKIWKDAKGEIIFQFFLFEYNKAVKLEAYPQNPGNMSVLESIIGSFVILR